MMKPLVVLYSDCFTLVDKWLTNQLKRIVDIFKQNNVATNT